MRICEDVIEFDQNILFIWTIEDKENWSDPEDEFHYFVRKLEPKKITLPEWKDLNGGECPPEESKIDLLKQSGIGIVVCSGWASSVGEAKKYCMTSIEEAKSLLPAKTSVFHVHQRKWDKLRIEDPVSFSAGFYLGSRKQDLSSSHTSQSLDAGWRQGWQFAIGKLGLPEWARNKKSA